MKDPIRQQKSQNRRTFLKSAGVLAVSLPSVGEASARPGKATLALSGGPKTINCTDPREAWRWPLYGEAELQAMQEQLEDPGYSQLAAFEKDWKEYTGSPYVKSHCNGTPALGTGPETPSEEQNPRQPNRLRPHLTNHFQKEGVSFSPTPSCQRIANERLSRR